MLQAFKSFRSSPLPCSKVSVTIVIVWLDQRRTHFRSFKTQLLGRFCLFVSFGERCSTAVVASARKVGVVLTAVIKHICPLILRKACEAIKKCLQDKMTGERECYLACHLSTKKRFMARELYPDSCPPPLSSSSSMSGVSMMLNVLSDRALMWKS